MLVVVVVVRSSEELCSEECKLVCDPDECAAFVKVRLSTECSISAAAERIVYDFVVSFVVVRRAGGRELMGFIDMY